MNPSVGISDVHMALQRSYAQERRVESEEKGRITISMFCFAFQHVTGKRLPLHRKRVDFPVDRGARLSFIERREGAMKECES